MSLIKIRTRSQHVKNSGSRKNLRYLKFGGGITSNRLIVLVLGKAGLSMLPMLMTKT